jgi:hypothetical protein
MAEVSRNPHPSRFTLFVRQREAPLAAILKRGAAPFLRPYRSEIERDLDVKRNAFKTRAKGTQ